MSYKIFMDLDGVLSEWVASAAVAFGVPYEELMAKWPPGSNDIESALGITQDELWAVVDAQGESFWSDLPETPWARRLYEGAKKVGPVVFLTSPSHHPSSLAGKLTWMQRFTGNPRFRDYLVGPRKEACASPGAILIDDHDGNLDKFSAAGGIPICVPRVWNRMHSYSGDPYDFVMSKLAHFVSPPANTNIGRAMVACEAASDRMRASLASVYENDREEMEDIMLKSREVRDLKSMMAGIGAQVAKEEYLRRKAGELFLNGQDTP
jgi:5'(3')-deoxyribonucleotidase